VRIVYGIDVFTPTNQRDDDPWKPVMLNSVARLTFKEPEGLLRKIDQMKAGNSTLRLRAVEVPDDDPTYSV
jgi:hypothetical protein